MPLEWALELGVGHVVGELEPVKVADDVTIVGEVEGVGDPLAVGVCDLVQSDVTDCIVVPLGWTLPLAVGLILGVEEVEKAPGSEPTPEEDCDGEPLPLTVAETDLKALAEGLPLNEARTLGEEEPHAVTESVNLDGDPDGDRVTVTESHEAVGVGDTVPDPVCVGDKKGLEEDV